MLCSSIGQDIVFSRREEEFDSPTEYQNKNIEVSHNGSATGFGPVDGGSIPSTSSLNDVIHLFVVLSISKMKIWN